MFCSLTRKEKNGQKSELLKTFHSLLITYVHTAGLS